MGRQETLKYTFRLTAVQYSTVVQWYFMTLTVGEEGMVLGDFQKQVHQHSFRSLGYPVLILDFLSNRG